MVGLAGLEWTAKIKRPSKAESYVSEQLFCGYCSERHCCCHYVINILHTAVNTSSIITSLVSPHSCRYILCHYIICHYIIAVFPTQLHRLLDFKELREFATLLKRYRDDLPVRGFLSKLKEQIWSPSSRKRTEPLSRLSSSKTTSRRHTSHAHQTRGHTHQPAHTYKCKTEC